MSRVGGSLSPVGHQTANFVLPPRTLEDETGHANIIVWQDLTQRFRKEVLHARLLEVQGVLQCQDNVIHIVARKLVDHTPLLGELVTPSRDFR